MTIPQFSNHEPSPFRQPPPMRWLIARIVGSVMLLAVLVGAVQWFIIRVEVNAGELLVLINKTGATIPDELTDAFGDQVILYPQLVQAIASKTGATDERVRNSYKGLQFEVRTEGRYFPNPYFYKAMKFAATSIGQGEIGVLVRKFGKPLPFPKTVATAPDERGPVAEILLPGRHNINLLAYEVQRFPAIQIPEGHVGVVTLLSGDDPKQRNTFTVAAGEKGVQHETLPPGLEYYNPYLKHIEVVDVRSQRYDMLGDDTIHFPSNDSFTITIEGTIEWAIRPDRVAKITVEYGDSSDILDKMIIPYVRGIARIQGSKLDARDFIGGKTRTAFQEKFRTELERECSEQGVVIRAALVRDIQPPHDIASLITQREQADQEIERSTNQMSEAKSEARLVEQREMQSQNAAIGDGRRKVVTLTKQAEQGRGVAVTQARRELEVAKLDLEAAKKQAEGIRDRGRADANVVLADYQARAEPLARSVHAFGDGVSYAQQFYLQKVAPAIRTILTNTDGPFAETFKQLQAFPSEPGAVKGGKP